MMLTQQFDVEKHHVLNDLFMFFPMKKLVFSIKKSWFFPSKSWFSNEKAAASGDAPPRRSAAGTCSFAGHGDTAAAMKVRCLRDRLSL